jgi:uncharacterized repeat protein (TIGR01451 family)
MKKLLTVFVLTVLVLSSSGVMPALVSAKTEHDGPGVDCGKGNDFQNNGLQKGGGPTHCKGDGEGEDNTGSITVCKVILDAAGNVINGTGHAGSFGIALSGPNSFTANALFNSPLTLNSNLVNETDDAQCQSVELVPFGTYNYAQETGAEDTSVWQTPRYNDQYNGEISNFVSDSYAYVADGEDGDMDDNDGVINVSAETPDRVIVVVNQLKAGGECDVTDAVNTYKSDASTTWGAGNTASVVVDPQNSGWSGAQIEDTDWIWVASATSDADALGATYTFTRHFPITGVPLDSHLEMSSDNGYSISVNGHLIDADPSEHNYQSIHSFNIPAAYLVTGDNVITFVVTNNPLTEEEGGVDAGTPANNPGGLTFKLDVHENDCVAPPQSCDANTIESFASGGNETFFSTKMLPGNAVPTLVHSAWATTATGPLTGATWIWDSALVTDPTQDETVVFTKHFTVTGNHIDAGSIDIAADNGYKIVLNGHVIVDKLGVDDNFSAISNHDIASALQSGDNELDITVKNVGVPGSIPQDNPAGVAYKINVTSDNCQDPAPSVCVAPHDVFHNILSDTSTTWDGSNPSVFVGPDYHLSWTALITGVKWIWSENPIADAVNETSHAFSRNFNIVGTPKASTLEMAADNSFTVWVNGFELGTDPSEFNYLFPTHTYNIPAGLLNTGANTIAFKVTNFAMENGTSATNPGGLVYKMTQNEVDCGLPPPEECPVGQHLNSDNHCTPDQEIPPVSTDISISKQVDNGSPVLNTNVVYTITVKNNSLTDNATGVTATDILPAGIDFVSDIASAGSYNSVNGVWTIGNLAANTTVTLQITAKVTTVNETVNTATVTSTTNDPQSNNNTSGNVDVQGHEVIVDNDTPPGGGGNDNPIVTSNFIGSSGGNHGGGHVLGASTTKENSCGAYLTSYLRIGKKNPVDQVKKLQTFLNSYLGLHLEVTGFFGPQTLAAVNQFQIKEGQNVLGPWVKAGLHDSATDPTGYVYKTTQRWINHIMCDTLNLPVPKLP